MSISIWGQNIEFEIIKNNAFSDSLYSLDHFSNADRIFLEAEAYFRKNKDWGNWYHNIHYLRRSYQNQNNYKKCEELIKKFETLIPEGEIALRAKISYILGFNYIKLIEYGKANEKYKKAIELFNSIEDSTSNYHLYVFTMLNSLSKNYSRIGDQKSAIKYCNSAIKICREHKMTSELCNLYINKGQFYYYDGQYSNAIREYQKANKICDTNSDQSYIHVSYAEILLKQNKYKEAKEKLELAHPLDSVGNEHYSAIYARYLFKIGNYEKGFSTFKKVIDIVKRSENKRYLINQLVSFAEILYSVKEKEKALSYAHKGLCLFYADSDSSDIFSRPVLNDKLPYTYIVEALYVKAKYFRERYLERNDTFALNEATFYYEVLLSHFDRLKSEYYSSTSKYRMGAYSQKIYSEIITFYVDQFKKNQNREDIKNAFSLAQRANSFVLRNAVSDRKALELAGVNQDSLEEYLQLAIQVGSDKREDSTRGANLFMEFDAYKEALIRTYPSYEKYDKKEEISIDEIQASINNHSLVLKYYYFNHTLTVIGISKQGILADNISFSEKLDSLVNINLKILSQNTTNDSLSKTYLLNSKRVYDVILGKLLDSNDLDSIDHLIIIPDGPLKKVSFNALAINHSEDWTDPNSYLLGKYAINYLYYSSQLKIDKKDDKLNNRYIGFGIEYEDDFLKEILKDYLSSFEDNEMDSDALILRPLRYADDEVLIISDILNGSTFINTAVTPDQVLKSIKHFDVVHFSAHAFVDVDDYFNSYVVLNRGDGENYKLKYSDILNLDLDSDLIVLSACQTSSGKSVVGEGLMSLSRAFVQSGSKAAVGAYWNASDYSTKEVMTLFYSNLKDGMSKSKAMQRAQLEYLTNDNISSPIIRSPFFWASWAIYGNDDSLYSQSFCDFTTMKIWAGLAIIGIFIFLLFKYFKRKESIVTAR